MNYRRLFKLTAPSAFMAKSKSNKIYDFYLGSLVAVGLITGIYYLTSFLSLIFEGIFNMKLSLTFKNFFYAISYISLITYTYWKEEKGYFRSGFVIFSIIILFIHIYLIAKGLR